MQRTHPHKKPTIKRAVPPSLIPSHSYGTRKKKAIIKLEDSTRSGRKGNRDVQMRDW